MRQSASISQTQTLRNRIILECYSEYDSIAAMPCAKFQKELVSVK